MPHAGRRIVASLLTAALLVIGGVAYPQLAAHAAHHAHHQAASHATVLCSWLCAAGQAAETVEVALDAEAKAAGIAPSPTPDVPDTPLASSFASRAPPRR